jgi:hypothetical protein
MQTPESLDAARRVKVMIPFTGGGATGMATDISGNGHHAHLHGGAVLTEPGPACASSGSRESDSDSGGVCKQRFARRFGV